MTIFLKSVIAGQPRPLGVSEARTLAFIDEITNGPIFFGRFSSGLIEGGCCVIAACQVSPSYYFNVVTTLQSSLAPSPFTFSPPTNLRPSHGRYSLFIIIQGLSKQTYR